VACGVDQEAQEIAPLRPHVNILGERNKRDFPPRLSIRSLGDQNKRGVPRRLSIRSFGDRNKQDTLSRLGIHSLRDRDKRGIPNVRDNHSPAARNPDIRKQVSDKRDIHRQGSRTRRPGSRNRCPVAVEV
jgi:hypothetical protein